MNQSMNQSHLHRIKGNQVFTSQNIGQTLEADVVVRNVDGQDPRDKGHSLDIANIRPIECVRKQQLPNLVVERLPNRKETQGNKRPFQILFNQSYVLLFSKVLIG